MYFGVVAKINAPAAWVPIEDEAITTEENGVRGFGKGHHTFQLQEIIELTYVLAKTFGC